MQPGGLPDDPMASQSASPPLDLRGFLQGLVNQGQSPFEALMALLMGGRGLQGAFTGGQATQVRLNDAGNPWPQPSAPSTMTLGGPSDFSNAPPSAAASGRDEETGRLLPSLQKTLPLDYRQIVGSANGRNIYRGYNSGPSAGFNMGFARDPLSGMRR